MIDFTRERPQRTIEVGIMSAPEIVFERGHGVEKVLCKEGKILYGETSHEELILETDSVFILHDVKIGIDFHWERSLDQTFTGKMKFIISGGNVTAINIVGIEDYLLCVISSEMKSSAGLELLKAHAIISRSWLINRVEDRRRCLTAGKTQGLPHTDFDVCADDHCQRYQGVSMAVGEKVRMAIDGTWGEVLSCNGKICDTRYSKCCGGVTELFSTCWEDMDPPYLLSFPDTDGNGSDPFCHTDDTEVLQQVLNDYDLETKDFFEWEVRYSRQEVSELVHRRTGVDYGTIISLEAMEKGPSGRIKYLKINGSRQSGVIGKELAIRHALSESHLKSSAFDIRWDGDELILEGRGWGHGVGLCQIGAAVMASKGYSYREILQHYYPGTEITSL